jgi:hypothetical protein
MRWHAVVLLFAVTVLVGGVISMITDVSKKTPCGSHPKCTLLRARLASTPLAVSVARGQHVSWEAPSEEVVADLEIELPEVPRIPAWAPEELTRVLSVQRFDEEMMVADRGSGYMFVQTPIYYRSDTLSTFGREAR